MNNALYLLLRILIYVVVASGQTHAANDAQAHVDRGVALVEKEQIEEAEAAFQAAIKAEPTFYKGHYNLGVLLYKHGKKEDAEAPLRAALRGRPDHAGAHYYLGMVLVAQNRRAEAATQFEAALGADTALESARTQLEKLRSQPDDKVAGTGGGPTPSTSFEYTDGSSESNTPPASAAPVSGLYDALCDAQDFCKKLLFLSDIRTGDRAEFEDVMDYSPRVTAKVRSAVTAALQGGQATGEDVEMVEQLLGVAEAALQRAGATRAKPRPHILKASDAYGKIARLLKVRPPPRPDKGP